MFKRKTLYPLFALVLALVFAAQAGISARADDSQKFIVSIDNVSRAAYTDSGTFNTPVGSGGPGPLLPGQSYSWDFNAVPGDKLSFATMFVQSNDLFFAPDENGIPLFTADGAPKSGDVTAYVKLWDAGTEGDQPLGSGADQAPRQAGPNSGPTDPMNIVRRVLTNELPAENQLIQATLTSAGGNRFNLRVQNISGSSSFPTPFAPGVGVVHHTAAPLFVNGAADYGYGLEALAEDGNPAALAGNLAARTGVNTPLAPVAWTVSTSPNTLFASGQAASAGLESLAEDGSPATLVASVGASNSGAAAVPHGAGGPAPIFGPSGNYSFEITASPGDHLSLATMFVQSNDWFYGLNNLPLFDVDGNPRSDNVTNYAKLYDAGTEVDETPGFGANQAPRQAGPNTGAAQGGVVSPVTTAGFTNPASNIHITISPVN